MCRPGSCGAGNGLYLILFGTAGKVMKADLREDTWTVFEEPIPDQVSVAQCVLAEVDGRTRLITAGGKDETSNKTYMMDVERHVGLNLMKKNVKSDKSWEP